MLPYKEMHLPLLELDLVLAKKEIETAKWQADEIGVSEGAYQLERAERVLAKECYRVWPYHEHVRPAPAKSCD
jgi:hypothetical protein